MQKEESIVTHEDLDKKASWTALGITITAFLTVVGIAIAYASAGNTKADEANRTISTVSAKVTGLEEKQTAQFSEILRSLERIEKQQSKDVK